MHYMMIDDKYARMPWDEIDAVVFDVGNVLLSFDPAGILKDLVPEVPELHPLLLQKIFHSPYWCMRDHGIISEQEAEDAMIAGDERIAPYVRRVMNGWIEMKDVLPEGLAALNACKAHGKKLYVLSNYADEPFAHVDAKYDFFRLFDGKVISSRVKLVKPDPAIFTHVIHSFGLTPARTLFIDDSPANIESALAMGWQGFCVNAPGKLAAFFAE